jgi:hypothetical protein
LGKRKKPGTTRKNRKDRQKTESTFSQMLSFHLPNKMPTTIEYVCPFCAEELPTRNYLRHILHNHRLALANSMTSDEKTDIKRLKVPIVLGKREGKRILATCLECETGHTTASRDKEAMNFTLEQIAEKHAKCGKAFDKWASYYIATTQVDVPNEVRKAGAVAAPTVAEAPAPPPEPPVWPVVPAGGAGLAEPDHKPRADSVGRGAGEATPTLREENTAPRRPSADEVIALSLRERDALKAALAEAERKIAEMRRVIQSYGISM